jgi:hypothetical protein
MNVQCFVEELVANSNLLKSLQQPLCRRPGRIQFMEGGIQFLQVETISKLNAQATPKRAKRRNQHRSPIFAVHRDRTLRQNIVAVR